jgi:hypothetical protein
VIAWEPVPPIKIEKEFPPKSVNVPLEIQFAMDSVESVIFWSNRDLTLKLKSGTRNSLTVNLKAGSSFEWNSSDRLFPNPIKLDVTSGRVTCKEASRFCALVCMSRAEHKAS